MTSLSTPEGANPGSSASRLIDSHAHLDFDCFEDDRDAVLARARESGVDTIISIGTNIESSKRTAALAGRYDMLWASAGIHPHEADAFNDSEWPELEALWARPEVCAIGETGLDYYYDYADQSRQRHLFDRHLEASARLDLPVIIHIRDAFEDAFAAIEKMKGHLRGVVHCFTGGPDECQRALDLGLYISLSGIVTFKSARSLQAAVPLIPDDRILVETDAPFLAPIPHRGQRNEPAFVVDTARQVAELRRQTLAEVSASTRANTLTLFRI
ncbi:MAG: TatD family hydrolase [Myxococcota bacterium]|nr:TatD family hydrolase [Myxococcota bacterium]